MPAPARIAVFPSPQGSKEKPRRGANNTPLLLRTLLGYDGLVFTTRPVKLKGPTNCPTAPEGFTSFGSFGFRAQRADADGLFFKPAEQRACWDADKLPKVTG